MSTQADVEAWASVSLVVDISLAISTRDWLTFQKDWIANTDKPPQQSRYIQNIDHLRKSDVAIFDVTVPSMRIGNEITLAVEHDIPVLVLTNKKQSNPDGLFLQGIASSRLLIKNYNDTVDLGLQTQLFLKKYKTGVRKRLDVAIDTELYQFVTDQADQYQITKIEMVRRILNS